MGQGERVARRYVGAVLLVQAVLTYPVVGTTATVAQIVAVSLLWCPLAFSLRLTPALRAATAAPVVIAAAWWAFQSHPLGAVAWTAWALASAALTLPASRRGTDTLAQRLTTARAHGPGAHHL